MVKKDLEEKNQQPVGADDLAPPPSESDVEDVTSQDNDLVKQLEEKIVNLEAKHAKVLAEAKETLHRNQADLENYRKRMDRELEKSKTFMLQKFCEDLLPVIDSVDAARKAAESSSDAVKNGLDMTIKLFLDVLAQHGVTKIETADQVFDPSVHEAMTTSEQPGTQAGDIVDVIQQGYMISGRLLRPARVIVAK